MQRRSPRIPSPLLLAGAGVVALGLGACSSLDEPAATVAGDEISEESLEAELDAITSNADYQASLEQRFQAPARGTGEGTYNAEFVARVLSLQVYYQLLDDELDERGIEVTDDDRDAVQDQAVQFVGSQEAFDDLAADDRERLVDQQALLVAAQSAFAGEGREEGDAEAFYEANEADFETRCLAHVLVGTNDEAQPTGEATRPEAAVRAQELYDELQAGSDFTELASSEANDDSASAAQGGDLGCITRQTAFDPTFLEAAFAADVGEVTEPVETPFGFHLILVSSAEIPPFEDVEAQIDEQLSAVGNQAFSDFLVEATCETDIEVASKYGSWDTAPCDQGGIGGVAPPEGPSEPTGEVQGGGAPGGGGAGGGAEDPAGGDEAPVEGEDDGG